MARIDDIIKELSETIYTISDEMSSKENYQSLIETVFDYLRAGFEVRELRCAKVNYRFQKNDEIRTMELRHFLTNIIVWYPFIDLDAIRDMDERIIFDTSKISSKYIEWYINTMIIKPYRHRVSNKKLNIIIHDLIFNLSKISTEFNMILGLTINIESFIEMSKTNERFNEIIHTKLPEGMQPTEIEETLHKLMIEEVEILKNTDNCLRPMLRSGTGIKEKQLSELSISGGLKPDIQGNTMPIPINSNLIVNGLSNVTNYYIDAVGGRKSLIANKTVMGSSGYFCKKVMLSVADIKLRKGNKCCNSITPIRYELKTKAHFERLIGRMYRLPNTRKYVELKETDTHLIGSVIYVKSPITCTDTKICKYCYGPALYHTNKNGVGIGAYAGAIVTNPINQSVLSTKHLLTTNSVEVLFNDEFKKFFTLSSNEIYLNSELDNPGDYSLLIINRNIITLDFLNEGEINEFVKMIHIKNNKTGEIYELNEESMRELFISPYLSDELGLNRNRKDKDYVFEIELSQLLDDETLFLVQIENNELTKPLYDIMDLLDSKEKFDLMNIKNISEMAQKLIDLLIESHINVQAVHGELLLRPLIRDIDNVLERPDFSKYNAVDRCQILTITNALIKHPSPLVGLSSSFLNRQIKSPLTFKKRGLSAVDAFYKETL
jgi:hypothetical protein